MSAHDVAVLAERVSAVERHLARIASKLPASAGVYEAAQRGPSGLRACGICRPGRALQRDERGTPPVLSSPSGSCERSVLQGNRAQTPGDAPNRSR